MLADCILVIILKTQTNNVIMKKEELDMRRHRLFMRSILRSHVKVTKIACKPIC